MSVRTPAVLLCLLPALVVPVEPGRASGRGQASWWVHHHGAVTAADEPLVARATAVFARVAAAADKRGNRLPRLLVVEGGGDPFAAAIEDGTVVLTREGLRRCFETPELGDARLAFVLGHELAHLAEDDFWHLAAFAAVTEHLAAPTERRELLDLLRATSDVEPQDTRGAGAARLKELEADSYGLAYMMMAGYPPDAVLAPAGGFLEAWASQATAEAAYGDPTHPRPAERAAFLRAQLETVREELDFFHFGIRLLQLGRNEDAILLLERFAERFPSREVYNALGLAHYRLAVRALHRCDPHLALRFRLSTELDPDTLADGRRAAARSATGCPERAAFRNHLEPAISYLRHAAAADPGYAPARINLASAHVLAGEHSAALGVLDALDPEAADSAAARNNRAVALYLFGQDSSIDTMDRSRRELASVVQRHPAATDALYNLGVMESERGRHAAAREHWEAFLRREPTGTWSARVRERLGAASSARPRAKRATVEPPPPPVPLGAWTERTDAELARMRRRPFRLGIFRGEFAVAPGTRILALEDFVEIVETAPGPRFTSADALARLGPPRREEPLSDGELRIWPGFAVELRGGTPVALVHFAPEAP